MYRHDVRPLLFALAVMAGDVGAAGDVVVIGNSNLKRLDAGTVWGIYTGRLIDVGGIQVTAVNAASESAVRRRFLQTYVRCDEDAYAGYWQTRKWNQLGTPPKALKSSADIIDFVKSTPGAIGYIDESEVQPGLNVLLKPDPAAARVKLSINCSSNPGTSPD